MVSAADLRVKRLTARIPAYIVCRKLDDCSPSRFSNIENERITVSVTELAAIDAALDSLIAARERIEQTARESGWPVGGGEVL